MTDFARIILDWPPAKRKCGTNSPSAVTTVGTWHFLWSTSPQHCTRRELSREKSADQFKIFYILYEILLRLKRQLHSIGVDRPCLPSEKIRPGCFDLRQRGTVVRSRKRSSVSTPLSTAWPRPRSRGSRGAISTPPNSCTRRTSASPEK